MDERQLLGHLKETLKKPTFLENWLDDDCEIIDRGNYFQLITIDTSSEKADFPSIAPPFDIGYFSTALSISDIAACGGTPEGILVSVSVSPSFDSKIFEIYEGVEQAAKDANTSILGGDSNSAGEFSISVVSIGKVSKDKILRRSKANLGDLVGNTGTLDKFNIGHASYHNEEPIDYTRMLRQPARVMDGQLLSETGGITSCIDLPDGLAKALTDNTPEGLGFHIKDALIPLIDPQKNVHSTRFESASQPAGDIELLFTADPQQATKLTEAFDKSGLKITWIGQVTDMPGINLEVMGNIHKPKLEGFIHKFDGYKLFP